MPTRHSSFWRGKSVLVVDDSLTSRTLIASLLKRLPVSVEFLETADQFRNSNRAGDFDLILLDFKMPDGNGVDLLKEFRRQWVEPAVVLVTGQAELHTATEALVEGADGYLEKRYFQEGPHAFHRVLEQAMLHREQTLMKLEVEGLRDEFYTLLAHDLRSPAACASVALKMYQKQPNKEVLETAVRSLDRLFYRLDRYLDYTKMEAGSIELDLQPYDLHKLLDKVVADLEPLSLENGLSMEWSPTAEEFWIDIDEIWLYNAFENLLQNAVKYTPAGGRVKIECLPSESGVTVVFSDTGPGIAPELLPRLFQRYYRVPQQQRTAKGTGLGLMIVKRVVEAHGGSVGVTSEGVPGLGSIFSVELPRTSR